MVYYYHPHTGRFERNTRSTVRASTVGPTSRRGLDDDLYFPKKTSSFLSKYDSTSNEYQTSADINRNLILSSAAMEDNYDISARSRQRDRDVMAAINRAVVNTEVHTSPRSAVAARRVAARGQSMPPPSQNVTQSEAALLASKVESMLPARRHGPRSKYAQEKMRSLRKEKRESVEPVAATVTFEESSKLKASPPIYVASNVKKPMWDSEGQLKKPNIMSWQYRLDTCVSPDDLIILPRSLNSVRERLRGCQDKLDRHRQLMDRYLVTDKGLTAEEQQALSYSKAYLDSRV